MTIRGYCPLFTVGLILLLQINGTAKDKTLELKWNELGPVVIGHNVAAKLPGGAGFRGEVVAVRDDSLVVDVN
jgi:hypothetical protein